MLELMTVRVELWPFAADAEGIWLVSGLDAWRPDLPIDATGVVHFEVEQLLAAHDATGDVELIHSTSWRPDGASIVLTFVAVLRCSGFVRDRWADAKPVSPALPAAVGTPPTHGAAEAPGPRLIDVVTHGLRHLNFLLRTDGTVAAALNDNWRRHLAEFEPALARMYEQPHAA